MNWEACGRKKSWYSFRCCHGICLEGQGKPCGTSVGIVCVEVKFKLGTSQMKSGVVLLEAVFSESKAISVFRHHVIKVHGGLKEYDK
jgi:hypothetical protein